MASSELTETYEAIARFVDEHSGTLTNALGNQARRMGEAADLAQEQGQIPYAKVFRAECNNAANILTELEDLLERLAEARQEEHDGGFHISEPYTVDKGAVPVDSSGKPATGPLPGSTRVDLGPVQVTNSRLMLIELR